MAQVLGIDIGGTGIKAAPVDVASGKLTAERQKLDTPHPAKPEAVAKVVAELVKSFNWTGPVGATFPGVVINGMIRSAANLDPDWIGVSASDLFGKATGQKFTVINDADAAGLAEMKFGAGVGKTGTVLMLTLGTGIGSALFIDGILVPNTEFGHIEIRGKDAEKRASEHAREEGDLSWGEMGRPGGRVPGAHGAAAVALAVHHRRRHQQEVGQVPAAADRPAGAGGAGRHAERRRDRRGRHDRQRAADRRGRRSRQLAALPDHRVTG